MNAVDIVLLALLAAAVIRAVQSCLKRSRKAARAVKQHAAQTAAAAREKDW